MREQDSVLLDQAWQVGGCALVVFSKFDLSPCDIVCPHIIIVIGFCRGLKDFHLLLTLAL